jgi:hypothetical protein
LIPGTLARQRMEWAIVSARWKWAVLGKDAPTFMAPDPFDRRDAICFEGGEWVRDVHTDDPAVRLRFQIDEDHALRILGVDPVEATKAMIDV